MCRLGSVLLLAFAPGLVNAAEQPPAFGQRIDNLHFKDIRYVNRGIEDLGKRKAFVLVFTSTSCPLVPRYFPTLKRLEKEYRDKGVQFLAVNVGADDSLVAVAAQAVEHEVAFPFVKDVDGSCVRAVGAGRTPEVVVLDGQRRLRYRGRIDDQYRPGTARPAPTRHDLKEAIEDVLAERKVRVERTEVEGCLITPRQPRKFDTPITFAEHVAPLLLKHCQECHRPGTAAPFSLLTFEQAKSRARSVAEVVRDGQMPPWFAAPGHGTFSNQRGLNATERETIEQWVSGGCLPGKLETLPKQDPEKVKAPKWLIGEPDLVLTSAPFELPAEGDIPYRYVIFPHLFLRETWVQSIQILPEKLPLVHHANLAFVSVGEGFKESNFLTGFVPGGEAMQLNQGVACRFPAGSMLALQIHFVASGKKETCRVSIGLRYARDVVRKQLRHVLLVDKRFAIPPGEPAHAVRVERTLDRKAVGVGLFSHMHLRGKAMTFTAQLPDGKTQPLLRIPNYHFAWQLAYHLEPGKVRLPRGTKLECVALYDNSPFNPFNPDPKATVRDGPQTYHEMLNGFFFYVDDDENLELTIDPRTGQVKK